VLTRDGGIIGEFFNCISFKAVESDTCYVVRFSRTELQSTDLHVTARSPSSVNGQATVSSSFRSIPL
jgi:hypothetical protein